VYLTQLALCRTANLAPQLIAAAAVHASGCRADPNWRIPLQGQDMCKMGFTLADLEKASKDFFGVFKGDRHHPATMEQHEIHSLSPTQQEDPKQPANPTL